MCSCSSLLVVVVVFVVVAIVVPQEILERDVPCRDSGGLDILDDDAEVRVDGSPVTVEANSARRCLDSEVSVRSVAKVRFGNVWIDLVEIHIDVG